MRSSGNVLGFVSGLGVFGGNKNSEQLRSALQPLIGAIPHADRKRAAKYLRGGALIQPWMTYTSDVLGDKFGVSGGTAVLSDGTYYWRGDAAEYVEYYGIEIPSTALKHMERLGWTSPALSVETCRLIDRFLMTGPRE